jgi:hypothetical protein
MAYSQTDRAWVRVPKYGDKQQEEHIDFYKISKFDISWFISVKIQPFKTDKKNTEKMYGFS